MSPLQQAPATAAAFECFLYNAQFQLPLSPQPFHRVKAHDPGLVATLYVCGDCRISRAVSSALQLSDTELGKSQWSNS